VRPNYSLISRAGSIGLVAWLALHTVELPAQDTATVTISGIVRGASGKHTLYVAIWSDSGFLSNPMRQVRIEAGREARFEFVVPRGRWAISAFEDRNEDGVLNIGWLGPREPNGFWRAFHGHHKPRFNEVANAVAGDIANADIDLRR
jgi:uncharacterized protein (DUF2141 family)